MLPVETSIFFNHWSNVGQWFFSSAAQKFHCAERNWGVGIFRSTAMLKRMVSRRKLRFEHLEGRAMMAGNVSAIFDNTAGGPLELTGDNAANNIAITQVGQNSFRVRGIGTKLVVDTPDGVKTVNSFTFQNVSDVTLTMNGGNDVVGFANARINGTLTVDMGSGNDVLTLTNVHELVATEPEGLASISLGTGNDVAVIVNFTSNADIAIDAGDGRDTVVLTRVVAGSVDSGNSLAVEMGPGDRDTLTVTFSRADFAQYTDNGGTNGLLVHLLNNIGDETASGFRTVVGGRLLEPV
jgi:hypothetical protein